MKKEVKKEDIAKAKERQVQSSKLKVKRMSSLSMSIMVSKSEENVILSLAQRCASEAIRACALRYNFSADEALELLKLNVVVATTKKREKKASSSKQSTRLPSVPIPFSGELIDGNCHGLKHNHGLFTQCNSLLAEGDSNLLCGSCSKQASKNTSGNPDCGRIEARLDAGLFDFRDPKGRKPVALTSLMRKMKVTREQIEEEAGKFNIKINPIHFEIPVAPLKQKKVKAEDSDKKEEAATPRGRPKKASKVVSVDATEDLFASLVSQVSTTSEEEVAVVAVAGAQEKQEEPVVAVDEPEQQVAEAPAPKKKASKKDSEEKEAKKVALAQAKAEKEAALAEAKAEKEAKKLALAQAKAEKEAALALAKAEKEAALALAKAEKEAALALAKAEKEAAKASKTKKADKKKAEPEAVIEPAPVVEQDEASVEEYEEDDEEEEAKPVVTTKVKKFIYKGTTYLKSADNVVYTMEQDLVGHWNEETKEIDVCEDDEEEDASESEDEEDA